MNLAPSFSSSSGCLPDYPTEVYVPMLKEEEVEVAAETSKDSAQCDQLDL